MDWEGAHAKGRIAFCLSAIGLSITAVAVLVLVLMLYTKDTWLARVQPGLYRLLAYKTFRSLSLQRHYYAYYKAWRHQATEGGTAGRRKKYMKLIVNNLIESWKYHGNEVTI